MTLSKIGQGKHMSENAFLTGGGWGLGAEQMSWSIGGRVEANVPAPSEKKKIQ